MACSLQSLHAFCDHPSHRVFIRTCLNPRCCKTIQPRRLFMGPWARALEAVRTVGPRGFLGLHSPHCLACWFSQWLSQLALAQLYVMMPCKAFEACVALGMLSR